MYRCVHVVSSLRPGPDLDCLWPLLQLRDAESRRADADSLYPEQQSRVRVGGAAAFATEAAA